MQACRHVGTCRDHIRELPPRKRTHRHHRGLWKQPPRSAYMPTAGRREPGRRRPVPERRALRSAAARRPPWHRARRSGWRWYPSATWPCWSRAGALANRRRRDRDVDLDLGALVLAGAAQHGALDLGGAQRRGALTLRRDDSMARSLGFQAFRRALRPMLRGAAQPDTSASGSIDVPAPVLAMVNLGADDVDVPALRNGHGCPQLRKLRGCMRGRRPCGRSARCALAGRPCAGRMVGGEVGPLGVPVAP